MPKSALPPPPPPAASWTRHAGKLSIDALLATLAWALTTLLHPGASRTPLAWASWGLFALLISALSQLFRQHYRFIGFRDFIRITLAMAGMFLAGGLARIILGPGHLEFGVWALATLLTGIGWFAVRAFVRALEEVHVFSANREGLPTLVIGAGRAGMLVAEELERHPELCCKVVGFLDDDLSKQGVKVRGIPVLGTQELLANLVQTRHIEQVVLAIPSASGPEIRRLAERAQALGIQVKTVPGIFNLLGGQNWKPEIRDISIDDLLRREPIQLDQSSLSSIVEDRVVLVTGAGGSIGSEVARQLCAFRPSRVILLGRGENSLWKVERSLRQHFPNQPLALELCDIRNPRRLAQAFERWKPEILFHAAAHKHVPFLELHPEEAIENNIQGTRLVLDIAIANHVRHFVNISTDKAVNPTNVLGASKRVAEMLVAQAAERTPEGSRYVSVRFGNVLGSRGSVVPIFREQIRNGGPLTVTDPEMTRYFMTIPEASQLVLQAGLLGETGKVYVLDMGDPVRIVDLARDMIRLSGMVPGEDIDIKFSGVRPGEKLFEELFYGNSTPSVVHPKVFEAPLEPEGGINLVQEVQRLEAQLDLPATQRASALVQTLCTLVPGYKPSPSGAGKWLRTVGRA